MLRQDLSGVAMEHPMPTSHPTGPSSLAKPLIIAGRSLPSRREIPIIVARSDYNFLFP